MIELVMFTSGLVVYRIVLAICNTGQPGSTRDKLRGVLGGGGPGAVPK